MWKLRISGFFTRQLPVFLPKQHGVKAVKITEAYKQKQHCTVIYNNNCNTTITNSQWTRHWTVEHDDSFECPWTETRLVMPCIMWTRHASFMRHFKKICGLYKHQISGGNMRKSLSYIFYGVSLAGISCRRRWPPPTSLALTTLLG